MSSNLPPSDIQVLIDQLRGDIRGGGREPYNFVEETILDCASTRQHHKFKRVPDYILIQNIGGSNAAWIRLRQQAASDEGYKLTAGAKLTLKLTIDGFSYIADAGTPKLYVLAMSYRDARYRARQ
jgi:hypothetical protein